MILENGNMLCQECYNNRAKLKRSDFVRLCPKCLDDLYRRFKDRVISAGLNPQDYIIGEKNINLVKGNLDID